MEKGRDKRKEGTFSRVLHMQRNSLRTFSIYCILGISLYAKIIYPHSPYVPNSFCKYEDKFCEKVENFCCSIFLRIFGYTNAKNLFGFDFEFAENLCCISLMQGFDFSMDRRYAELMTTCIANTQSRQIPESPRGVDDSSYLRYAASAFTPNQTIPKIYLSAARYDRAPAGLLCENRGNWAKPNHIIHRHYLSAWPVWQGACRSAMPEQGKLSQTKPYYS